MPDLFLMNTRFFTAKRDDDPTADLRETPRTQGAIGQVVELFHDRGYGFLVAGGRRYFFHRTGFVHAGDFDQILAGSYVTFEPVDHQWKGPRAEHLELA